MRQLSWHSWRLRHFIRSAVAFVACLTLFGVPTAGGGGAANASPPVNGSKLGWIADPPDNPGPTDPGAVPPMGPPPGPVDSGVAPAPAPADPAIAPPPNPAAPPPPGPENDEVDGPASPEDCQVIRATTGRIDVLAMRVAPVSDPFPTKEAGEAVIDSDLTMLNSIVTLAVSGGANVQEPREKNKFEAFKNAVIAMSGAYTERRGQDLTKPAKAEWAAHLAQLLDAWTKTYNKILNSCYV